MRPTLTALSGRVGAGFGGNKSKTTSSPPVKTSESCSETTDRSVSQLPRCPDCFKPASGNLWFVSRRRFSPSSLTKSAKSAITSILLVSTFWAPRPKATEDGSMDRSPRGYATRFTIRLQLRDAICACPMWPFSFGVSPPVQPDKNP